LGIVKLAPTPRPETNQRGTTVYAAASGTPACAVPRSGKPAGRVGGATPWRDIHAQRQAGAANVVWLAPTRGPLGAGSGRTSGCRATGTRGQRAAAGGGRPRDSAQRCAPERERPTRLYNSYRQDLSVRDALKSRRLITSAWYQIRWGTRFQRAEDQNLKGHYDNDQGGYRTALSVGGGNTGKGGDRIVADDPHNVREGESELNRGDVLSWWNEVMPSRRNDPKNSSRVLLMQRVHEQDVVGDALSKGGYHLLRLPMEYDPKLSVDFSGLGNCWLPTRDDRTETGELLWPERYGPDEAAKLKRDLGSYAYAAQYQQNPVPRTGSVLDPGLFKPLPAEYSRAGKVRVQFWDTAFSEKKSADHTAAVTLDATRDEKLFITHLFSERLDGVADPENPDRPTKLDLAMVEHIVATRPDLIGEEKVAFKQKAIADLIRRVQKLLRLRGISVSIKPIDVDGDKVTRAQIVAGRAQAGDIHADKTHPRWTEYSSQLSAFPKRDEDVYRRRLERGGNDGRRACRGAQSNKRPYCSAHYALTGDRDADQVLSVVVNRAWRGDAGGAPLLANGGRGDATTYESPRALLADVCSALAVARLEIAA
jgi:predicted phage terminase large subunit-like protein